MRGELVRRRGNPEHVSDCSHRRAGGHALVSDQHHRAVQQFADRSVTRWRATLVWAVTFSWSSSLPWTSTQWPLPGLFSLPLSLAPWR